MNDVLRLDARDDRVWSLTLKANTDSRSRAHTTTYVCRRCGRALATAGLTAYGPLFTSRWEIESELDFEVNSNGTMLGRAAALKARDLVDPPQSQSGSPIRSVGHHGVIALLTLPANYPPDFPDLLVRCTKEGRDAVLSREDVLNDIAMAGRRVPGTYRVKVDVRDHWQYEPQRPGGGTQHQSSEVRTFRFSAGLPASDLRTLLGDDAGAQCDESTDNV